MIKYGLISETDARCIEKTFNLICDTFPDEPLRYCEIGLYNAKTTEGVSNYLKSINKEHEIIGIESMILGEKIVFFPEYGKLILGNSIEVYNQIPDDSQHFILIDGNHSFPYVVADFFCYKDKIKKGGYICFHDASPQTQWKGWQGIGDEHDPDMAIAVMKALEKVGLLNKWGGGAINGEMINHTGAFGFELTCHEWDVNDEGGGVIIFQKKY